MSFLYLVIITGWHSSSTVTCAKERWSSKCTSMVTVKSSCGRPPGPCANSLDHFMIFTTSLESLVWVQPSKLVLLESGGRCRNCCSLVLFFGQAAKTLWAGFCYGNGVLARGYIVPAIPWPCLVCRNSLYYPKLKSIKSCGTSPDKLSLTLGTTLNCVPSGDRRHK